MTTIAELARWRVILVALVLGMVSAAFISVGVATDNIPIPNRPLGPDGIGFTFATLCLVGLFGLTLPYLVGASLGCSGLYIADGRLILLGRMFRSLALAEVRSITLGREGIFEGEPVAVRFNLDRGRDLTVYTVWFKTPTNKILSRLQQAGLTAPVRTPSGGGDAASDGLF